MNQPTKAKAFFTDLLVIGAGPVGLAMGIASAQAGFATVLADSADLAAEPKPDGRSFAISAASMHLFQSIGIAEKLRPHLQPVQRMAIGDSSKVSASDVRMRLAFDVENTQSADGAPLAFICENNILRSALLDAARTSGNISLASGHRLESLTRQPGAIMATFAGGSDLSAHLIVGADGRNSAVRKNCAIDGSGWAYEQTAIAATIAHTGPHHAVAHDLFFPSGPLGILPLPGNRSSIVWCERPKAAMALAALSPAEFCAELNQRMGNMLGSLQLEGERSTFPLSVFVADRMITDRIALVGDAAHGVHPLAGQGLNIGLRDAAALIETISDARALGQDIGAETTLDRYQRWRRFDNLSYAAGCDGLNWVFGQTPAPFSALRSAGLALVNAATPIRNMLAREASGLSDQAPRLLRPAADAPTPQRDAS